MPIHEGIGVEDYSCDYLAIGFCARCVIVCRCQGIRGIYKPSIFKPAAALAGAVQE